MEPLIDLENLRQRRRLVKLVNKNSVDVKNNIPDEVLQWCIDTLGTQRKYHPIYEAMDGWMDHFEGSWAVDFGKRNFWFESPVLRTTFILRWHGELALETIKDESI